jgi:hypothetical protein
MSKTKKKKKTYGELVSKMEKYEIEISILDVVVRGYRDHLEKLSFMVESYVDMKKDLKKLSKFINKKTERETVDGKENSFGNEVQYVPQEK